MSAKEYDPVNNPEHYTHGSYECIEVMMDTFGEEATADFCLLNAFKYIWRAKHKNGLEDIKKAIWYLNRIVTMKEQQPKKKPAEKPASEPKAPKAKSPKPVSPDKVAVPKPPIDHGKILALHNAGWCTAKIADELGCSQQTVLNHINREKEVKQSE